MSAVSKTCAAHEGKAYSLASAHDDCQLYVGLSGGRIIVYDLHTAQVIKTHMCNQPMAIVNTLTVGNMVV